MDTPEKKSRAADPDEDDPILVPDQEIATPEEGEPEPDRGDAPEPEVPPPAADADTAATGDDPDATATAEPADAQQLEETRGQLAELNDKYLRIYAEFDNFRKRTAMDREELRRYANEEIIAELLSVLDHLDMAVQHSRGATAEKIVEGVQMTLKEFERLLEKFGVRIISAAGQAFDPNLHHAMAQIPTDEVEPNTVVEEFRKGYQLHDKLIRAALVSVARPPENGDAAGETPDKGEAEEPPPEGDGEASEAAPDAT